MDLKAGIIYKTKDYDKFIIDSEYNRDVNENHVKKLIKSFKLYGDYGHCYPIVVDDKFKIIDGQHRFNARKEAGLIIYYIQDIELDSKILGGINDAIVRWRTESFTKVAKDNKILKLLESIVSEIPSKININVLLNSFSVNKTQLLTEEAADKKYILIEKRIPLFVHYINLLETKITDFYSTEVLSKSLCSLSFKLAKYGVKENEIEEGSYNEVIAKLYLNKLIK